MDALSADNETDSAALQVSLDEKVKSGKTVPVMEHLQSAQVNFSHQSSKLAIMMYRPESEIENFEGHDANRWTNTAKVNTKLKDGSSMSYFLKKSDAEGAETNMRGEFESQKALNQFIPSMIAEPIEYGQFESDPRMFFFLSKFVEMTEEIPQPPKFCAMLADLHLKSMEQSKKQSKEQYGFDCGTTQGNILFENKWCSSWTDFFANAMRHIINEEAKTQGTSKDIEDLTPSLIDKVIPRLLRPLESGDERITPCLLHGDLWHANASVSVETGEPYMFDSCAFWGHNEYDMGLWRASRYKFGRSYVREYQKHVPISSPVVDWDDRNALYAIRADLLCSALFGSNQNFRKLAIVAMKRLVQNYPDGYENNVA